MFKNALMYNVKRGQNIAKTMIKFEPAGLNPSSAFLLI